MQTRYSSLIVALLFAAALESSSTAAEAAKDLEEVQNLTLPELRSVTSVAISRDGKFAYAAAFHARSVTTFKRDSETGLLSYDDVISAPGLNGAVSFSLSLDEKYAVASAWAANTVTVFKRDAETGRLSIIESATEGLDGAKGLSWVVSARFSPKGDFLYCGSANGLSVFEFKDEKMEQIQYLSDGRLKGIRAVAFSPRGEWLYIPAMASGSLGVLRRDATSGCVEVAHILSNADSGTKSLAGAFRSEPSADGKFLYVSSGRFRGDQAVSAFEVTTTGELKLLQEFSNGTDGFTDFKGGNSLALSPDGKSLFALASASDRLFRFQRDPATGKLTFLGSQQVGKLMTPGSAGLCFSGDGKFVYVADEAASAIVAYRVSH